MQECTFLLLDLFPGDSLDCAGFHFARTAHDFLLPGGFGILIDDFVEACDQAPGKFSALLLRQGKRLLEQLSSFLSHTEIIVPCARGRFLRLHTYRLRTGLRA